MNARDRDLLTNWLPRGWYAEAIQHFAGKHSGPLISRVKNGHSGNLEILRWLVARAMKNKREMDRVTSDVRSLRHSATA